MRIFRNMKDSAVRNVKGFFQTTGIIIIVLFAVLAFVFCNYLDIILDRKTERKKGEK